jgi:hypothetical protein
VESQLTAVERPFVKQCIVEDGVRVTQLFFHDPDCNMIEVCNCDQLPVGWQLSCALRVFCKHGMSYLRLSNRCCAQAVQRLQVFHVNTAVQFSQLPPSDTCPDPLR